MIESSEGGAEFVEMQITFKGNNHDTRNLNKAITESDFAVLKSSPRERAKALSYCQPRRGGGVKVLLRYFLTRK